MQRFQRYDDQGWFKAGQVEVTTSILFAGLAAVSIVLWVVSKTVFVVPLILTNDALTGGQIWRLVTWPFVNDPDLWIILSIAMMVLVGSEIERELGRRRYAWLLGCVVVVPALAASALLPSLDGIPTEISVLHLAGAIFGLNHLVSALFVVLVLWRPTARTFFELPLWVFVVLFEVIQFLQILDARESPLFRGLITFWALGLAVAALGARAFGITDFTQIPKIPLPAFVTGDPYAKANRAREKAQRQQSKGTKGSSGGGLRRQSKEPAPVIPIRPEARLDRADQADMDALLDKISATGIDSLTTDERARLDDLSRRLRGQ